MFKMSWGKYTGRNFKQTIRTTKRTKGCHVVLAVNGAVFRTPSSELNYFDFLAR